MEWLCKSRTQQHNGATVVAAAAAAAASGEKSLCHWCASALSNLSSGWTNKIYMHTYCKSSILIKTKTVRIFILWFIQIAFICVWQAKWARARAPMHSFSLVKQSLDLPLCPHGWMQISRAGDRATENRNEFGTKAQLCTQAKWELCKANKGHNSLKQSLSLSLSLYGAQREIMRNCIIKNIFLRFNWK